MLGFLLWAAVTSIKAFLICLLCFLIPYMIYFRVYCYFKAKWHYKAQGVRTDTNSWPILGSSMSLLKCIQRSKQTGDNYHPLVHLYNDSIGKYCGVYVFFMINDPCISIQDPKIVQALCTT
jgi:hypothetical protein